jgi:hypothetical protein
MSIYFHCGQLFGSKVLQGNWSIHSAKLFNLKCSSQLFRYLNFFKMAGLCCILLCSTQKVTNLLATNMSAKSNFTTGVALVPSQLSCGNTPGSEELFFYVCVSMHVFYFFFSHLVYFRRISVPMGFSLLMVRCFPVRKGYVVSSQRHPFPIDTWQNRIPPFPYVRDVTSAYLLAKRMHRVNCSPISPTYSTVNIHTLHT